MSNPFSSENVARAVERLPRSSTAEIRTTRERAAKAGAAACVEACDAELARRPVEWSGDLAERNDAAEAAVADKDFHQAVMYAFKCLREANEDEKSILRWIAANPGGSHTEALAAYGKGDFNLALGHVAYDRWGAFRRFAQEGDPRQSSVLVERHRGGPGMRYTLRLEAEAALREVGIL